MSDPGVSKKYCPNCGAEVRAGDYICENCGTPLPSDTAPAPPPPREAAPEEPAASAPEPPPTDEPGPPPTQAPDEFVAPDSGEQRSDRPPESPEAPREPETEAGGPRQDQPAPEQPAQKQPAQEQPASEQPGASAPDEPAAAPGPAEEPATLDEWRGSGRGSFVPVDPTFGNRAAASGSAVGGSLLFGAAPARQAALAAALAAAAVVLLVILSFLILTFRWLVGLSGAPGLSGIFGFVAAHGGAILAEVPETPALLGLGGSLTVDPPLTTLALFPFLFLLGGSWLASRRLGAGLVFVGALTGVYAVLVALTALLGRTSAGLGEGAPEVSVSASPLSAALHGVLIAALAGLIGVVAARGPLLPDRARQVIKGAFVAVGVSVVLSVFIAVVLSLVVSVPENPLGDLRPGEQPADRQPADRQPPDRPDDEGGGIGGLFGTVGSFVALLPAGIGTLWLLAHGIPVGVQNVPDLGNLPGVGAALGDATLSAGLLSNWPFSGAWRLLLLAPVVGLVAGGAVAARGAASPQRLLLGALVAAPYFVVVGLTALLTRIGLGVSVAGFEYDTAVGAALFPGTLLVLPLAAILGTAGALLARAGELPRPRPRLVGTVTAGVCALLVIGTLPLFAASNPEPPAAPAVGGLAPGDAPEITVPETTVPGGTGPEGTVATPEATGPEDPQQDGGQPEQPADPASTPEADFIDRYYSAAAQEDWAATYALLASDSRAEFTQDEWVEKQSAYLETSGAPLVQSAEVTSVTEQGSESVVNVTVTYEDGSQNVLPSVELVEEDGEWRRRLTDAEIERVRSVPS